MRFKPGVGIRDLTPQALLAMGVVERVALSHFGLGYEPTITSCDDSVHGPRSLHPTGRAIDVRTKDILPRDKTAFVEEITKRLNGIGFDVVYEDDGGPQEHIHIEYDPKAGEA